MNAIKLIVIAAAAAFFIAACSQSGTNTNTTAGNTSKPAIAASPVVTLAPGQELYAANCQICM